MSDEPRFKSIPLHEYLARFGPSGNRMDAPDGPMCACGLPSALECGTCLRCAELDHAIAQAKRTTDMLLVAREDVRVLRAQLRKLAAAAHEVLNTPGRRTDISDEEVVSIVKLHRALAAIDRDEGDRG